MRKSDDLVSVIIPTYLRTEKLKNCLQSVLRSRWKRIEVIVVEDYSGEKSTIDELRPLFPSVKFIKAKKRLYASGCRNLGIDHATGNFLFFLDDDNVIAEDTIDHLVETFYRFNNIGFAGPVAYYKSSPTKVWSAGVMVTKFSGRHVEHPIMSDVYDVDVIPNAFMTTREVINRIGKFDEVNFPMQQEEEHDIQTRAKEMGYRVVINPKAKVWHDYPEERKLNSRLTPETIYYIWRNRIWHEKIHNRRRYATMSLFLPTYFLYYLLTIIESRKTLKEKSTCLVCMVKGMYSGIFRSPHTKHHV